VDWIVIVIDNPKLKLYLAFELSIQFFHFNPNPRKPEFFINILKFHSAVGTNNEAKLIFIQILKQLIISKDVS